MLNFASNDYLGLGDDATLHRQVAAHFARYGASSSSSRLVSGNYALMNVAENAVADYFGYDEALFFPSGYQANLGVLSTFFESGDIVIFDKHVHNSSVKGLELSGARLAGYRHNSMGHLARRLEKCGDKPVGVVTESLFSMDGDRLDTIAFGELKRQYGFICLVDEAHAFGVLGPQGRGIAGAVADVAVGTFGKALGLFGAFALMPRGFKSYLLNFASPQIYTTALPEAHAAAVLDVLDALAAADAARCRLAEISRGFRDSLAAEGFQVRGDAHILAVAIGDEQTAVTIARELFQQDVFVLPARFPTVPLGQAILRISLTAQHTAADVKRFVHQLKVAMDNCRSGFLRI